MQRKYLKEKKYRIWYLWDLKFFKCHEQDTITFEKCLLVNFRDRLDRYGTKFYKTFNLATF